MTVDQLIAKLKNYGGDMEVHFAYDYGDRPHTLVAPKVKHVQDEYVEFSEYHRMPKVIEELDGDEEDEKGTSIVVVLS